MIAARLARLSRGARAGRHRGDHRPRVLGARAGRRQRPRGPGVRRRPRRAVAARHRARARARHVRLQPRPHSRGRLSGARACAAPASPPARGARARARPRGRPDAAAVLAAQYEAAGARTRPSRGSCERRTRRSGSTTTPAPRGARARARGLQRAAAGSERTPASSRSSPRCPRRWLPWRAIAHRASSTCTSAPEPGRAARRRAEAPLVRSLALAALTRGDFAAAHAFGEQLATRGERAADDVLWVESAWVLGVAAYWGGQLDRRGRISRRRSRAGDLSTSSTSCGTARTRSWCARSAWRTRCGCSATTTRRARATRARAGRGQRASVQPHVREGLRRADRPRSARRARLRAHVAALAASGVGRPGARPRRWPASSRCSMVAAATVSPHPARRRRRSRRPAAPGRARDAAARAARGVRRHRRRGAGIAAADEHCAIRRRKPWRPRSAAARRVPPRRRRPARGRRGRAATRSGVAEAPGRGR